MNELDKSRKEINRIDVEMARLFEERMNIAGDIADYKKTFGLSVRDGAREAELIARNRGYIENPDVASYYVKFLRDTIDISSAYQLMKMDGMHVAYCGAEGAFAYIAAKRMYPGATLEALPDFASAYHAVEDDGYDCVVLPLENSYAGEVGTVMDLMFMGNLYVNQVIDVNIVHNLLAAEGATLDTVRTVVSHPQALEQCDKYIKRRGFDTMPYSNTALAAKYVRDSGDATLAAIASDETAGLFGLKLLDANINASSNNTTRFAAFSRAQNELSPSKKREDEAFMLMFTVKNEAGSLAQTLNIIGSHGFNMRNLRSRPMKGLLWNYYFYIEAEGSINSTDGRDMMRELSAVCAKLKLIGSYYANNMNTGEDI